MVLERPDYAKKQRIEKRLLYADGRQLTAYLGLVDDNGAFLYMCDTGEAEHVTFHPMDALIVLADTERKAALEDLAALRKLYAAQEEYIDTLCGYIRRACALLDDAFEAATFSKYDSKSLHDRKRHLKAVIARKVVLDDGDE